MFLRTGAEQAIIPVADPESVLRRLLADPLKAPLITEDLASLAESAPFLIRPGEKEGPIRCESCGTHVVAVPERPVDGERRWTPAIWEESAGRKHTLRRCEWWRVHSASIKSRPGRTRTGGCALGERRSVLCTTGRWSCGPELNRAPGFCRPSPVRRDPQHEYSRPESDRASAVRSRGVRSADESVRQAGVEPAHPGGNGFTGRCGSPSPPLTLGVTGGTRTLLDRDHGPAPRPLRNRPQYSARESDPCPRGVNAALSH